MTQTVAEFYAGRSVFVTGATGFLGKCLIEKLIRSCPDIGSIYVLVRAKRGVDPRQRVQDLVTGDLFQTLRDTKPGFESKVVPVCGDLLVDGLGMSEEDIATLRENVSVIIHVAATVNFNEHIKTSLQLNVIAVKQLLAMSRTFKDLKAFVHTSTAYSQCDREHIEERFYEPAMDVDALIQLVKSMPEETAAAATPGLLGKRPNTYTLTKSLAEAIVKREGQGLPVAVMRPSIVAGIRADPVPGWQDNLNGPAGMYVAASAGMLRVMQGNPNAVMDLVPVDHCTSLLIAIGWKLGTTYKVGDEPKVYHCTSGTLNPCTWGEQIDYSFRAYRSREPLVVPLIEPSFRFVQNPTLFKTMAFFVHTLPCVLGDTMLRATGQKPVLQRIFRKLNNAIDAFHFFISHQWRWDMDNTMQLRKDMAAADRTTFEFDMTIINWPSYIESFFVGARRFVPRQDPAVQARNRVIQRLIHFVFLTLCLLALAFASLSMYNVITGSEVTATGLVDMAVSRFALPASQ